MRNLKSLLAIFVLITCVGFSCASSQPSGPIQPAAVYVENDTARVDILSTKAPTAFSHKPKVNEWLRLNGYTEFVGPAPFDTTTALWTGDAVYVRPNR